MSTQDQSTRTQGTQGQNPAPSPDGSAAELVLREAADGVAVLRIHRPEVHNAMNRRVLARLEERFREVREDPGVDVVVVTGSGEKAFVAGADITELRERTPVDGLAAGMQTLYSAIADFPKPTIAAINGYAFGGGLELALACDIRIAATSARMGLPETGLGIIPAAGGTQRLARVVGVGRATDMILTGRRLTGQQAHDAGLVTELVEPEQLLATARETAQRIRAKGPLAIRLAKTVVASGFDVDRHTGLLLERLAQSVIYSDPERTEGVSAFVDKRTPDFHSVHHARRQQNPSAPEENR